MEITKVVMDAGDRMVRVGLGQHKGKFFIRFDFWWIGFRLTFKD